MAETPYFVSHICQNFKILVKREPSVRKSRQNALEPRPELTAVLKPVAINCELSPLRGITRIGWTSPPREALSRLSRGPRCAERGLCCKALISIEPGTVPISQKCRLRPRRAVPRWGVRLIFPSGISRYKVNLAIPIYIVALSHLKPPRAGADNHLIARPSSANPLLIEHPCFCSASLPCKILLLLAILTAAWSNPVMW